MKYGLQMSQKTLQMIHAMKLKPASANGMQSIRAMIPGISDRDSQKSTAMMTARNRHIAPVHANGGIHHHILTP